MKPITIVIDPDRAMNKIADSRFLLLLTGVLVGAIAMWAAALIVVDKQHPDRYPPRLTMEIWVDKTEVFSESCILRSGWDYRYTRNDSTFVWENKRGELK